MPTLVCHQIRSSLGTFWAFLHSSWTHLIVRVIKILSLMNRVSHHLNTSICRTMAMASRKLFSMPETRTRAVSSTFFFFILSMHYLFTNCRVELKFVIQIPLSKQRGWYYGRWKYFPWDLEPQSHGIFPDNEVSR